MLLNAAAVAAPTVTGNTISWPDDGWYQVQRSDTYESICNGGSSCKVANGKYQVINHTTGERFKNIIVNAATTDPVDPVDPSDFNLLDASRDLIASLAGYELDQLAVVVDDLAFVVEQETTIVWPDSDYYQVQKAPESASDNPVYETMCNGEPVCQLVPGAYTVINQTSGARSALEVPYIEPSELPGTMLLSASTFTYDDADPYYATATVDIERMKYNCEGGGSVVIETGLGFLTNQDGTHTAGSIIRNGYLFDQCRMSMTGGLLPNDTYLIQGNLFTLYAGNNYDDSRLYNYESFSINGDSGLEYLVDGDVKDIDGVRHTSGGAIALSYRDAVINEYQKTLPDGQSVASIAEGRFAYEYGPDFLLDVSGVVRNEKTANQNVSFSTDAALSGYFLFVDPNSATPFTGSINLLADDGSLLNISAQGTETDAFAVLNDYTTAYGERIQESGPTLRYFAKDFNTLFEVDRLRRNWPAR